MAKLRPVIAAAARMSDEIKARRMVPEASLDDAEKAIHELDAAVVAYGKGEYWFARGQLERTDTTLFAYASGRYPPGVLERSVPLGVPAFSDAAPAGLKVVLGAPADRPRSVDDLGYDAAGRLWVATDEGLSQFDGAGKWLRNLPVFAPYDFEHGDIRKVVLAPPRRFSADLVSPLGGDRVLMQRAGDAPSVFDTATGRFASLALGDGYFTNSRNGRVLAARADGTALSLIADKSASAGLRVYARDGTYLRSLADASAVARRGTAPVASTWPIAAASNCSTRRARNCCTSPILVIIA